MVKPAKKASLAKRAAAKTPAGRALLKRALADPGLRSKLDIGQLRPEQQASRKLTARLAAPVVPGSSMTEGELARSSKLQAQVKYAPAEAELGRQTAEAQQQARDVGGFYDQYLAKLAQNQRDVGTIQQSANQQLGQVAQGITGLSASGLQSLQSAADADAAARGATAGDQTKLASDTTAIRQALMGSFQAKQILQGAAANTYASGMTDVVAPAQKRAAQAQEAGRVRKLREKGLELQTEKGTFTQQQREAGRAEESKIVAAKEIAGGKSALEVAKLKETVRTHKAGEKLTGEKIAADATQKQADRDAKVAKDAAKASEPNKYGVPADQWAKWSTSHRQRVMNAKGKDGKGPDWQASGQQQTFWKSVDSAAAVARKLGADANMTQGQRKKIADKIMADPKNPGSLAVSVALDKIIGHIAPPNVKRLHDANIQVKTGGIPTRVTMPKKKKTKLLTNVF